MGGLDEIDKLQIEPNSNSNSNSNININNINIISNINSNSNSSRLHIRLVSLLQTPQIAGSEIVVVSGFAISASFFTGFIWSVTEDAALVRGGVNEFQRP
ncbi:hypothetical protein TrLO_g9691 [Triparma laevis f. longispina]|uniref:Uncharacterized protein n=1 Tax=Triparma laevis f. longispina TaxID=1714387 RepID=A0A9W7FH74_9STRA|nr:hypothetical protein TrLO_g9691 [Triparma laevis f. longispina]